MKKQRRTKKELVLLNRFRANTEAFCFRRLGINLWLVLILTLAPVLLGMPSAQAQSVLNTIATFPEDNPDGVIIDSAGNLYWYTSQLYQSGTISEIAKGTSKVTILASLHGVSPNNIAIDSSGNLFGVAVTGDAKSGTVFEKAKGSQTSTTVASLHGLDPLKVVIDKDGNLFIVAERRLNQGMILKIVKGSHTVTTLATFHGRQPLDLILDGAGNLFGNTWGGTSDLAGGTVYEIAKGSRTVSTLDTFRDAVPDFGCIDEAGNIFGTTMFNSANVSTIFRDSQRQPYHYDPGYLSSWPGRLAYPL